MAVKILNVLVTYVPEGKVEAGTPIRSSKNPDFYTHFDENKFETIKHTVKCHEHFDAGMDYDLIIVDNDSQDADFLKWLDTLPYKVYHRENVGFSFGGFKWAFEQFGDKYDYILFEEQDLNPAKDGWLKEIYTEFTNEDDIGAVGNKIERRGTGCTLAESQFIFKELYPDIKVIENLDGPLTFTSTRLLRACLKIHPWKLIDWTPDCGKPETTNELIFQMPIVRSGYKLKQLNDDTRFGTYGVSFYDNTEEEDKLPDDRICPMVHGNARFFNDRFKI